MRLTAAIVFISLLFCACQKEKFTANPSATLQTSVDTLHFDTVFTTTGSITQSFKIFNNNEEGIRINAVSLGGGSASAFKINADGTTGPRVTDLEIAGNDSAYVFVTVNINPNAANLPFVVRDSIQIEYNTRKTIVQLEAYGQNAHFLRSHLVTGTETWTNDLPYVILGGLLVDENAQLTINKGCKIYAHADAPIIVQGTLKAQGEKWDSTRIIFTGDRLDDPYRDYPASWPGLIFTSTSKNNLLQYAVVKNAYQAIAIADPATTTAPKLTLSETIIDNAYDAGILAINSSITAQNVLISNCGKNIFLAAGGNYNFTHCTAAAISNNFIQHKDPVLFASNFLTEGTSVTTAPLTAVFRNCILWGDNNSLIDNEVVLSKNNNAGFNVSFDGVLWRVKTTPTPAIITNAINNQDPQFDSLNITKNTYSFRLKPTSPAINKGVNTGLLLDLDGAPRPVGLPDLGAYEKQ